MSAQVNIMRTRKLINLSVLNPLQEKLGVFSHPSYNDIVKHGGTGVKLASPVGYNSYLDRGKFSAGNDDTSLLNIRNKRMIETSGVHLGHIYIFLAANEARDYVDGKYSIRFYRPDMTFKGHRTKYPDEFIGHEDYNSRIFECREFIAGFRTLADALNFRRLCMNKRCYQELCNNIAASFKNFPEFHNRPVYLDEIMMRSSTHILAVPIPESNAVYSDTIWFNPTIPLLAFKLQDTKVKYVEVPILPDKTYIPITEPWHDEKDKKKNAFVTGLTVDVLVDYSSPSGDFDALQQDVPSAVPEGKALPSQDDNKFVGAADTLSESIHYEDILTEQVNLNMLSY